MTFDDTMSSSEQTCLENFIHLPVINISNPTQDVGRQMLEAAAHFGFFYVDSRSLPDFTTEVVDHAFELSRSFFASPEKEKRECVIGTHNRGWAGMHVETLDPKHQKRGDFKECLNIGEYNEANRPTQKMPKALENHIDEIGEFSSRCRVMCNRILELLALGLEIPDSKWLSSRHTYPSGSTLRFLFYPALPDDTDFQKGLDIRAGAHSDYGSITLLFQRPSQPGLDILTPSKQWAPVPVFPPSYPTSSFPPVLVNIADLLSYWTNGLLRSTVHRVNFPAEAKHGGEDRYSIVYFCHPGFDTELVAVPSKMVQEKIMTEGELVGYGGGIEGKKALTAKEHLEKRLEATYGFRQEPRATVAEA